MCNFRNTKYTCGCEVEEIISLCGWVHDDMSECMNNSQSVDLLGSQICGAKNCKNKGLPLSPYTTRSTLDSNIRAKAVAAECIA